METLKNNDDYIIVEGDKNLGPCILERSRYIHQEFREHLGNTCNYKQLSAQAASGQQNGLQYQLRKWIGHFRQRHEWEDPIIYVCISEAERVYLKRALEYYPDKLARYRQTCKVHKVKKGNKNPPVRPIICCAGTFMNCWSK